MRKKYDAVSEMMAELWHMNIKYIKPEDRKVFIKGYLRLNPTDHHNKTKSTLSRIFKTLKEEGYVRAPKEAEKLAKQLKYSYETPISNHQQGITETETTKGSKMKAIAIITVISLFIWIGYNFGSKSVECVKGAVDSRYEQIDKIQ